MVTRSGGDFVILDTNRTNTTDCAAATIANNNVHCTHLLSIHPLVYVYF